MHSAFCSIALALLAPLAQTTDPVQIDGGSITGVVEDGIVSFKGIPFAAPPTGQRRWRPPAPVEPWQGVRHCDTFSPICPQAPYPAGSIYARDMGPASEDCLYLNVWAPKERGEAPLPVMVWIHGGALTRGSGSHTAYDGSALARRGVVLVTINYRLNVFGYLAHPELTAESDRGASGNYGVLDQIAALQWVQRHIKSFGGDPARVTIFGESAGSFSVSWLVASPLAKGLFHRAIGQSGAAFRRGLPLKASDENESSAESIGVAFQQAADAESLADLRALPADRLVELAFGGSFRTSACIDGWVLSQSVLDTYAAGQHNDVPVIVGSNADEMTTLTRPASIPKTLAAFNEWTESQIGELADEFRQLYPAQSDEDVRAAYLGATRDRGFTLSMRTWARETGRGQSKAYLYLFSRVSPFAEAASLGAFHAAEISYAFDNLGRSDRAYSQVDHRLSDTIASYWVQFAATGDPNRKGLPRWEPYDAQSEPYLDLGDEVVVKHHLMKQRLDFWEKYWAAR